MKKLLMLAAMAAGLMAQTQTVLQAVAPLPVQGLGNGVVGTPGTTVACYWVVTNYIGGGILSAAPTCASNVPNSLSSSNYVLLTWQAVAGTGVTYDVLKTTTNAPPAPGASVGLTTGLTTPTYNDQGGSLSPYTIAAYPYATGSVLLTINNRDYAVPAIVCTGTVAFPCWDAVDQVVPKAANQVIRLGGQATPLTIDKTGALYITQGSATPGSAVGSVTAGAVFSVSATLTLAQVNAGTVILPAVSGQTYKISHFLMTSTGSAAGCTSINIDDTAGTPIVGAAVAVAALTDGTPVNEAISGVTLTAFAPTALTASKGIQVVKVGSSCTTTTALKVIVYFTINS